MTDIDAHAWVEAWFPHYGWVTFDPTPAAAPARGGVTAPDLADGSLNGERAVADSPAHRHPRPGHHGGHGRQRHGSGSGIAPLLIALVVAIAGGCSALGSARWRRTGRSDRRAARRARAGARPQRTAALRRRSRSPALERRFRASPEAAGVHPRAATGPLRARRSCRRSASAARCARSCAPGSAAAARCAPCGRCRPVRSGTLRARSAAPSAASKIGDDGRRL